MRTRFLTTIATGIITATAAVGAAYAASSSSVSIQRDGSIHMDGHALKCGNVRNVIDRHLPNLGMAGPGVLAVNPGLLSRYPKTVRLFVFYHECGHHHVGGSELKADCWAVNKGLREGWLDKAGLTQVCHSFGNDPETETHPAGPRRCRSLDQCFTATVAAIERERRQAGTAVAGQAHPPTTAAAAPPKLLIGPTLVRSGTERAPAAYSRSFQ